MSTAGIEATFLTLCINSTLWEPPVAGQPVTLELYGMPYNCLLHPTTECYVTKGLTLKSKLYTFAL